MWLSSHDPKWLNFKRPLTTAPVIKNVEARTDAWHILTVCFL